MEIPPVQEKIDPALFGLSELFHKKGYELYLVGGAVRNLIRGTAPQDWDLCTDASPLEIQSFYRKTIPTGIQHGTLTLLYKHLKVEVTTFRCESDYQDHRKPQKVHFVRNLEEDLKRRDFTINALAIRLQDLKLFDLHQGLSDLESGIIRAIGNPEERFREDALRMLRAFRFQAQLGFRLSGPTLEAVRLCKDLAITLSRERVLTEWQKLIKSQAPQESLESLRISGLWSVLFPDSPQNDLSWKLAISSLNLVPKELYGLRTALCFLPWAEILPPQSLKERSTHRTSSDKFLQDRLKAFFLIRDDVKEILNWLTIFRLWAFGIQGSFPNISGEEKEVFKKSVLILGRRDKLAQESLLAILERAGQLLPWPERKQQWAQWLQEPIFLEDLDLDGESIMKILGRKPGPWLGEVLETLQIHIWRFPADNEKPALEKLVMGLKDPAKGEA